VHVAPYRSRLIAEFIGTFFFFFVGFSGIAAAVDLPGSIAGAGVAAGFGLGLALAIFAFGHISGGHYNPAVTLGLAAGRQFPLKEVPGYWIAQFIGGACAAGLVSALHSDEVQKAIASSPGDTSVGKAFVIEAVATFLFVMLISAVATDKRAPWNGVLAPLAIGGFIFTAALTMGPFTSGSFNPARSLAPALYGGGKDLWVFIVAPLVGGIVGGVAYWAVRRDSGDAERLPDGTAAT
jgi:MIP family channel proteins